MITTNNKVLIDTKKSVNTIDSETLHKVILENGGSMSYHQISEHFGLISKDDLKIGTSLNSSIRGKIRSAWCGRKNKTTINPYQVSGKGQWFKMDITSTKMEGENKNIKSSVL